LNEPKQAPRPQSCVMCNAGGSFQYLRILELRGMRQDGAAREWRGHCSRISLQNWHRQR
jgi:hypothetical protein